MTAFVQGSCAATNIAGGLVFIKSSSIIVLSLLFYTSIITSLPRIPSNFWILVADQFDRYQREATVFKFTTSWGIVELVELSLSSKFDLFN